MKSLNNIFTMVGTLALASCIVASIGCEQQTENSEQTNVEQSSTDQNTTEQQEIRVEVGDRAKFDEMLGEHQGKVVIVDFWATWCGPCVKMFPHTVELANKFDSQNVAVIGVSMDEPEDEDRVLEFLKKHDAHFQHLLASYGIGSDGFEEFEIPDGAVPHFRVYDAEGNLHFSSSTNEEIEAKVEELLNTVDA